MPKPEYDQFSVLTNVKYIKIMDLEVACKVISLIGIGPWWFNLFDVFGYGEVLKFVGLLS